MRVRAQQTPQTPRGSDGRNKRRRLWALVEGAPVPVLRRVRRATRGSGRMGGKAATGLRATTQRQQAGGGGAGEKAFSSRLFPCSRLSWLAARKESQDVQQVMVVLERAAKTFQSEKEKGWREALGA